MRFLLLTLILLISPIAASAEAEGVDEFEPSPNPLATEGGCLSELAKYINWSQISYVHAEQARDALEQIAPERREHLAAVTTAFEEFDAAIKRIADALFNLCATYR